MAVIIITFEAERDKFKFVGLLYILIIENLDYKEIRHMKIILFGTIYGSSKLYAEELSKRTGIETRSYDEVSSIDDYDTIVYIGSLYAGGVQGMKKTLSKLTDVSNRKIIIATVGLADPTDPENINNIRNSIKTQLSDAVYNQATIFHLRGAIDYAKLGFKHKTMMSLLYNKAKNLPEAKKTVEVRAMIETYNKQVSFIDYESLTPIVELV